MKLMDEPLVTPIEAGAALQRLIQVQGVLKRESEFARVLGEEASAALTAARTTMESAIEGGDNATIEDALRGAQNALGSVYESVQNAELGDGETARVLSALRFPHSAKSGPQPVDVSTVIATHVQPERQVYTHISFQPAPGATFYWLVELRTINGETYSEETLDTIAPFFRRVRLGAGERRFIIRSRDASTSVDSEEFTLTIPAPQ